MTKSTGNNQPIELQRTVAVEEIDENESAYGTADKTRILASEEEPALKSPSQTFFPENEKRLPLSIPEPPFHSPSQVFFNREKTKSLEQLKKPSFNVIRKPEDNSISTSSMPVTPKESKAPNHPPVLATPATPQIPLVEPKETISTVPATSQSSLSTPKKSEGSRTSSISTIPKSSHNEPKKLELSRTSPISTTPKSSHNESKTPERSRVSPTSSFKTPKGAARSRKSSPKETKPTGGSKISSGSVKPRTPPNEKEALAIVSITPQGKVELKRFANPFFTPNETVEKEWKPSKQHRLPSTERDFIPSNLGNWRPVGYRTTSGIHETKELLLIEKRTRRQSEPSIYIVGETKESLQKCRYLNKMKKTNIINEIIPTKGHRQSPNTNDLTLTITPLDKNTKKKVIGLLNKAKTSKSNEKPLKSDQPQSPTERKKMKIENTWGRRRQEIHVSDSALAELKPIEDIKEQINFDYEHEKNPKKLDEEFEKNNQKNSNPTAVKRLKKNKRPRKTTITPFSFMNREEEYLQKKRAHAKQRKFEFKRWARPPIILKKKPFKITPPSNKCVTVPTDFKFLTDERQKGWMKFLKEMNEKQQAIERERKRKEELAVKELRRKSVPKINPVPFEKLGIPRKEIISPFRKLREECYKIYSPFFHGKKEIPKFDAIINQNVRKEKLDRRIVKLKSNPNSKNQPDSNSTKKNPNKVDKKLKKFSKNIKNKENINMNLGKPDNTNIEKNNDSSLRRNSQTLIVKKEMPKTNSQLGKKLMKRESQTILCIKKEHNQIPASPGQLKQKVKQPLYTKAKATV